MKVFWSLFKRELFSSFGSPIAYVFLVIFLVLAGFFSIIVSGFFERGEADLQTLFFWLPWLYLLLVPALGMRLWSEELRQGTLELLFTMPAGLVHIIAAKFFAAWCVLGLALLLTLPLAFTANYLGDPDNGLIVTGYLAAWLMAGSYLALASAASALTRNQIISFIVTVVICLFLVLAGWPPVINLLIEWAGQGLVDAVAGLSFMTHFEPLQRGILDARDMLYFISVIVFGLGATAAALTARRLG